MAREREGVSHWKTVFTASLSDQTKAGGVAPKLKQRLA
jgi:hypothetical protein